MLSVMDYKLSVLLIKEHERNNEDPGEANQHIDYK